MNNLLKTLFFQKMTPGSFRLLLAALVMVYHSVDFLTIGHYAVYVFFMLSGYWIFKMYNEKYSTLKNSYRVYLISRISRLMPLYWVILFISVIVYLAIPAIGNNVRALHPEIPSISLPNIFVLGLANSVYMFIVSAWSLDIELQFYILAPLFLFVCKRKAGLVLLALSSMVSLFLIYNHYQNVNIIVFLPYFMIGGLVYIYEYKATQRSALLGIYAIVAILVFNYAIPGIRNDYLLNRHAVLLGFNYREGLNVVMALLTIPFVAVNVRQRIGKEDVRRDQTSSSMSYVIYLLHWPLLQVYAVSVDGVVGIKKFLLLALYYIGCFILSYLISKYVDQYFESIRRRWLQKQADQRYVLSQS